MLYIGLDIHLRMSVMCILDENGKLVKFTTVHGPWRKVIEVLKGLKQPFAICYEASCGYGHTAHYLARVMLAMLRSGECWRFDHKQKDAA